MTYKIPIKQDEEIIGSRKAYLIKKEKYLQKNKEAQKYLLLQEIKDKKLITEQEINLIKGRLNKGTYKIEDVKDLYDLDLTQEQNTKGFIWLFDKWKSAKTGKERKDNPYGYREQSAIETFEKLKLDGFTNVSYTDYPNYIPIYRVKGKEGHFEYYVQGGKINITG